MPEKNFWLKFGRKKKLAKKIGNWLLAVGRWPVAGGGWQVVVSRWQVATAVWGL